MTTGPVGVRALVRTTLAACGTVGTFHAADLVSWPSNVTMDGDGGHGIRTTTIRSR